MTVVLHDHFHPPLSARRHWHAFHNAWATYLASDLNSRLPEGYFAEPNVQFGIEIDVAAFEEPDAIGEGAATAPGIAIAAEAAPWAPPTPAHSVPFSAANETVEVLVYDSSEGPILAGAVELVSPANKDRPAHRQAFVSKCETYLQAGAGLVIADIVSDRRANLHDELLARLGPAEATRLASHLYATAYHVVERDGAPTLDIWQEPLAIGGTLPSMPLWLRGGLCLPVELAASYDRTCREQRVRVSATGT